MGLGDAEQKQYRMESEVSRMARRHSLQRSLHLNVKRGSGRAEEDSVTQHVSSKAVLAADVPEPDVSSSGWRAGRRSHAWTVLKVCVQRDCQSLSSTSHGPCMDNWRSGSQPFMTLVF